MIKEIITDIKGNFKPYLLILLAVVISDDTFWFQTAGISLLVALKYGFIVLLSVLLAKYVKKKDFQIVFFVSFFLLLSCIISSHAISGGPLMLVLSIVSAFGIARYITINSFYKYYCNIILLLIIYSGLFWILLMVNTITPSSYSNVEGVTVMTYGGCIYYYDSFGILLRNSGLCREPGVFTVLICVAFILDAFTSQKLNYKRLIIYVIGVFSTLSTAGVIILAVTYFLYILKHAKSFKTIIVPLLLSIFVVYTISKTEELAGDLFGKIERGVDGSESVLGRQSSVTIPLKIIASHPLFGCGIDNFKPEYIYYGKILYNREVDPDGLSTNTILNAMAIYGLWYGIFLLWGLYRFVKRFGNTRIITLFIYLSVLLCLSNESMLYSMIIYIIVAMGIANRNSISKVPVAYEKKSLSINVPS